MNGTDKKPEIIVFAGPNGSGTIALTGINTIEKAALNRHNG